MFHDRNNIVKRHRHSNILSFSGGQGCLRLKFGTPNDGTSSIEYNPSTAGLGGARIDISNGGSPVAREVSIAIAFESFLRVRIETNSNVTSFLQVSSEIENGIPMRLPRVS